MQSHLFHPICDWAQDPQPADKEERLKIIIANLEQAHRETR